MSVTAVVLAGCGGPATGERLDKAEYERQASASFDTLMRVQDDLSSQDFASGREEKLAYRENEYRDIKRLQALNPPAEIEPIHNAWVDGNLGLLRANLRCLPKDAPRECADHPKLPNNHDLYAPDDPADVYLLRVGGSCFETFGYDIGFGDQVADPGLTRSKCLRAVDPKVVAKIRGNIQD